MYFILGNYGDRNLSCCTVLHPLVINGVIVSSVYYFAIFYLIIMGIWKINLIYIAFVVLLIQRPNIQSIGYSIISFLFILSIYYKADLNVKKQLQELNSTKRLNA